MGTREESDDDDKEKKVSIFEIAQNENVAKAMEGETGIIEFFLNCTLLKLLCSIDSIVIYGIFCALLTLLKLLCSIDTTVLN